MSLIGLLQCFWLWNSSKCLVRNLWRVDIPGFQPRKVTHLQAKAYLGVSVIQALFSLYFSYMGCFHQLIVCSRSRGKTNKYINMHTHTLFLENNFKKPRKHLDLLADSCKRLSVDRMAAGSRLQIQVMDFFFFHPLFKHVLSSQVKGFRPHGLLAYRLCLPPDIPITLIFKPGAPAAGLAALPGLSNHQCIMLHTLFYK